MRYILPVTLILGAFAATPAFADCTCRAMGRDFQHGEQVCLRNPSGQTRIATCSMVLNNSAWEFSETPCVSSRKFTPVRVALARVK